MTLETSGEKPPRGWDTGQFRNSVFPVAGGTAVALGSAYLGFRMSTDVIAPANEGNALIEVGSVALPTVIFGGLGGYLGLSVAHVLSEESSRTRAAKRPGEMKARQEHKQAIEKARTDRKLKRAEKALAKRTARFRELAHLNVGVPSFDELYQKATEKRELQEWEAERTQVLAELAEMANSGQPRAIFDKATDHDPSIAI